MIYRVTQEDYLNVLREIKVKIDFNTKHYSGKILGVFNSKSVNIPYELTISTFVDKDIKKMVVIYYDFRTTMLGKEVDNDFDWNEMLKCL